MKSLAHIKIKAAECQCEFLLEKKDKVSMYLSKNKHQKGPTSGSRDGSV